MTAVKGITKRIFVCSMCRFLCTVATPLKELNNDSQTCSFDCNTYASKYLRTSAGKIIGITKMAQKKGSTDKDFTTSGKTNPVTVHQRYRALKESGFTRVNGARLANFLIYTRSTIAELKEENLIPSNANVSINFMRYLRPRPKNFRINYNDDQTWSQVHYNVLVEYLVWRLEVPREDVELMLTKHSDLQRRSFRFYCDNINLFEKLGFELHRLLTYCFVLKAYPPYWRRILSEFRYLAGGNFRKEMRDFPRLITVTPENVKRIYSSLKSYGISDSVISTTFRVFQLSPKTVEKRLAELKSNEELWTLRNSIHFLDLIVCQSRVKSRLDELHQKHWRCYGRLPALLHPDAYFDNFIKMGFDRNSPRETQRFIQGLFGDTSKVIDSSIGANVRKHPFWCQIPFSEMERTYNFLRSQDYTNDEIRNAVCILLYSKDAVEGVLNDSQHEYLFNISLKPNTRLNVLIYLLERDHHFTGNGVWWYRGATDDI